jgi:periplasmic protein TonB
MSAPAEHSVPPLVRHVSPVESRRRELPWLTAAIVLHGVASLGATMSLNELRRIVREMRSSIRDQLALEVSIEPASPERPPEPAPPPEPEAAPPPPPVAPPKDEDPYDLPPREEDPYDLPPAPAEATKVLTREPEVAEKPAETFATGEGQGPGYGMVAGAGTGSSPTFSRHATVGGVPGGRGARMPPPPPPDLSRPPALRDPDWGCDFPAKAEADGLMSGVARFTVTVRSDGVAQAVQLVLDPGHGFGAEAYRCAMRQRYIPGRDRAGRPITAVLGPIGIRFMR